jgi:hypothetical protein
LPFGAILSRFQWANGRLAAIAFFVLIALTGSATHAGDAEMKAAAKAQANDCAQAYFRQDYDAFAAKMYPKLLEMSGGKENLIRTLQDGRKQMLAEGGDIRSATIGDVTQLKESHSQEFAIVPETLEISMREGTLTAESYMLGISDDGGKTWTFLDGAGVQKMGDSIRTILPNFPADLALPAPKQPTFVAAANPATSQPAQAAPAVVLPVEIDRADFRVNVPRSGAISPPPENSDSDHYVYVTFPKGNILIFLVVDDKADGGKQFEDLMAFYAGKLKDPAQSPSDLFDSRHGQGKSVTGTIATLPYTFEGGVFNGKTKAFIVVGQYPQSAAAENRAILRAVLDSFFIKE